MSIEPLLTNFLNPPILFFFLGLIAVWARSDLDLPAPIPKALSLYLLLALGFKGGVELSHGNAGGPVWPTLAAAVGMAVAVPLAAFAVLRRRFSVPDAAATAAAYGSVSAVTFIAATSFLQAAKVPFGGHLIAAMALMESPAILIGVALARRAMISSGDGPSAGWGKLLREAFFNGSVLLLLGSLAIGGLTGERGREALAPMTEGLFKGLLCLFLLDMGLVSARRLGALRRMGAFPIIFAILTPLAAATVALGVAWLLHLPRGDALLFVVLAASASYIAVPAALRTALPEANPGVYVPMALAVTFPFNVLVGLPLYYAAVTRILP